MRKSSILFVGMDVHKESIEIAIAEDGAKGEVRRYGRIGGTFDALKKALRKLVAQGNTLHFSYEVVFNASVPFFPIDGQEAHMCYVIFQLATFDIFLSISLSSPNLQIASQLFFNSENKI